jgi:hypothetical protein
MVLSYAKRRIFSILYLQPLSEIFSNMTIIFGKLQSVHLIVRSTLSVIALCITYSQFLITARSDTLRHMKASSHNLVSYAKCYRRNSLWLLNMK